MFWPSVSEMALKAFSGNVPPSTAVSALIFPLKTSGLSMRDYEDDNFEEVSKSRFLVGTEDVIGVDEVSKCREGFPDRKPHPLQTIHMLLMGLQDHVCTLQPSTSINIFTDTKSIKSQNCLYTSVI